MEQNNNMSLVALDSAKQNFALAMKEASSIELFDNAEAAFQTAVVVNKLEAVLTDEIMDAVFMPLMNKKIGFKTDRDPSRPDKRTGIAPKPYSREVVRTCIIDAAANGLLATGNQFNIISGTMYPTKEGYTALLAKLKATKGLMYSFEFDYETTAKSSDPSYVAIPCRISYKTQSDKGWFKYVAMVKSNGETSTTDQLRGKAERKCKRAFFEFLTGMDLGDADAAETVDVTYTEVSSKPADAAKSAKEKAKEMLAKKRELTEAAIERIKSTSVTSEQTPVNVQEVGLWPATKEQPEEMTDEEIERGLEEAAAAQQTMNMEGGEQ